MFYSCLFYSYSAHRYLHSFPTRRSSDLIDFLEALQERGVEVPVILMTGYSTCDTVIKAMNLRSEEHTSELQSRLHLVCRLLLEKKKYLTGVRILDLTKYDAGTTSTEVLT